MDYADATLQRVPLHDYPASLVITSSTCLHDYNKSITADSCTKTSANPGLKYEMCALKVGKNPPQNTFAQLNNTY